MNCQQTSTYEFGHFTKEHLDPTSHPCYGLGDGVAMGIPVGLGLMAWGICVPINHTKRVYENLTALDGKGHSIWSQLSIYDRLTSVVGPLLMTGAGLAIVSGGIVFCDASVNLIQECFTPK